LTEIDIEFAKWGQPNPADNAQYVVQPWDKPGNLEPFLMALNGDYSTHYINWQASSIHFKSIHGHHPEPSTPDHLIYEWLYIGSDIPAAEEALRVHINLWLFQGNPPSDGQEVEVIVKDADLPSKVFLPLILKPPPWITVTASRSQAWGEVGPSSFCNANYKVALYAKTDIWYVQPYDDSRRNVQINLDCTWQSFIHPWDEIAAHLVPITYTHPSTIGPPPPSCPPLKPDAEPDVLAASCYP